MNCSPASSRNWEVDGIACAMVARNPTLLSYAIARVFKIVVNKSKRFARLA